MKLALLSMVLALLLAAGGLALRERRAWLRPPPREAAVCFLLEKPGRWTCEDLFATALMTHPTAGRLLRAYDRLERVPATRWRPAYEQFCFSLPPDADLRSFRDCFLENVPAWKLTGIRIALVDAGGEVVGLAGP